MLASSIASTLDDVSEKLVDYHTAADELSLKSGERCTSRISIVDPVQILIEALLSAGEDTVEILAMFDNDFTTGTQERAEKLSRTTEDLSKDSQGTLDGIIDISDCLKDDIENERELLRAVTESMRGIISISEEIDRAIGDISSAADADMDIREQVERVASATREAFDALSSRLEDTAGVMKEMTRELYGLRRENSVYASAIATFGVSLGRLAVFESVFTGISAGMDSLALIGRLDSLRAGEKNDTADTMAAELEAISADAASILGDYRSYIDTLSDMVNGLNGRYGFDSWETRYATVRNLVDDTEALLTDAASSGELLAIIERTIADSDADSGPATRSIVTLKNAATGITGTIGSTGSTMEKVTGVIERLAESTEKIGSLADEMHGSAT